MREGIVGCESRQGECGGDRLLETPRVTERTDETVMSLEVF